MNIATQERLLSVTEYLEGEQLSETRHEYLAGLLYAMPAAGENHNLVAGNIALRLHAAARGKQCKVFIIDMKVRVERNDAFYYPDVMVTCDPQDTESLHKHLPCLIVEVLSPATEAIDRREKLVAYRTLPSLRYYLLVAQDQRRVEMYLRGGDGNWCYMIVENAGEIAIACDGLSANFSLDDVYEDVRL